MRLPRPIRRLAFRLRWAKWFWSDYCKPWPIETLYGGWNGPLDKDSRRIIQRRMYEEAKAKEPKWEE